MEKNKLMKEKTIDNNVNLPDNPRYLLWMLYVGKNKIPDNQADYINWITNKTNEYQNSNELWDKYNNFDEWLIDDVRNYLVKNYSQSTDYDEYITFWIPLTERINSEEQ